MSNNDDDNSKSGSLLRSHFVQTFVGACATVLLGVAVAFVSGILTKIDSIAQIANVQAAQTAQLRDLKVQLDERDKHAVEIQVQSVKSDGALSGQILSIQSQHEAILREIVALRMAPGGKAAH